MAWSPLVSLKGPSGDLHVQPGGAYSGAWRDANTGAAGMAVTGDHVVTDINTPLLSPTGCSLSRGTVTVTQPGVWLLQGTIQYRGDNTSMRAVHFVRGTNPSASPKYGLLGMPSGNSMATSATFTLAAGDTVSFCTSLWSGGNLVTWLAAGCTVMATWLGNPAQSAATLPPPVVARLTDASTIVTDASVANYFRVSMSGNRTLGVPRNPTDGQRAIWELTAAGGQRLLAPASGAGGFVFGRDIAGLTPIAAGTTDYLGAIYSLAANRWRVVAYSKGF